MIDEEERLGVQQRVGAQPALDGTNRIAVLQPEPEPLRRDDEPASRNAIGAMQRLLHGPGGFATEHGQPVEAPLSPCSSSPFGLRDP